MQERVVLEELNRDLSAAQARVERWAQSKISSAAELKEKHAVNVESLRARIAGLTTEQKEILEEAKAVQKRIATEQEREGAIQGEVQESENNARNADDTLLQWQAAYSEEARELDAQESALSVEMETAAKALASVQEDLKLFEERLGLTFIKSSSIEGELLLKFTHLNPAQHDQEFLMGVTVQNGQHYTVTTCKPQLPNIEEMRSELNKSGSFRNFVFSVRQTFQRSC